MEDYNKKLDDLKILLHFGIEMRFFIYSLDSVFNELKNHVLELQNALLSEIGKTEEQMRNEFTRDQVRFIRFEFSEN